MGPPNLPVPGQSRDGEGADCNKVIVYQKAIFGNSISL